MNPIRSRITHGFLFLAGGGINTAFSYGLYFGLITFLNYNLAYFIAFVAGIFTSWLYNSLVVFKTPLRVSTLLAFPLVYIVQYFLSAGILALLVEVIHVNAKWAPLLVTALVLPVTYLLSRRILTHRKRDPSAPTETHP